MHTYLIMQHPGHSRVFYEQSGNLCLAELKIACERFETKCQGVELMRIADIRYISIKTEKTISEKDLVILSRLSFVFALFKLVEVHQDKSLVPIAIAPCEYISSKISNLLKYSGKTNELFTKMMVNVALLTSDFDYSEKIQLLDPVAGKGTTLFEGAIYGFDVAGIEIQKKQAHDAYIFFKKYLETEKYKHKVTKRLGPGARKSERSSIQEFEYSATKEEFKNESSRKRLSIVSGDSVRANKYFKNNSFHLIVGDLPYGVAHGNVSKRQPASRSRSPSELLNVCLPEWYKVLKKKGVLVLSWNKFVMPKDEFISLLTTHGFTVLTGAPYDEFEHRVDMSIKRDMVVARKLS